jgi:hypothetical protein
MSLSPRFGAEFLSLFDWSLADVGVPCGRRSPERVSSCLPLRRQSSLAFSL